jgi:hypothetical protein
VNDHHTPDHETDRLRLSAYVLVALLALLAGIIIGVFSGQSDQGSRAGWPPAATNPRSLSP